MWRAANIFEESASGFQGWSAKDFLLFRCSGAIRRSKAYLLFVLLSVAFWLYRMILQFPKQFIGSLHNLQWTHAFVTFFTEISVLSGKSTKNIFSRTHFLMAFFHSCLLLLHRSLQSCNDGPFFITIFLRHGFIKCWKCSLNLNGLTLTSEVVMELVTNAYLPGLFKTAVEG